MPERPWCPTELLTLRDGRQAQLRPVRLDDAKALAALTAAVVADGRGVVLAPADLENRHETLLERLQPWHDREPEDGVKLVAIVDGQLVAEATAGRLGPSLIRHVALVDIQVHPDAQGTGLGRALMERLVAWSEHGWRTPVRRLELYVRADNARARALYGSLGFVVEGVRRDFVRLPDGRFVDDLVMGRVPARPSAPDGH